MLRREDWHLRLTAYLVAAQHRSFQPGRHDCALFVAGAVEAMTGIDPALGWRGRYRTLRGGVRVLRASGYADHIGLVAAHLAEIAPAMAGVGDVAVLDAPDGAALGVVVGPAIAVLRPDTGLDAVPLTQAKRAFRV